MMPSPSYRAAQGSYLGNTSSTAVPNSAYSIAMTTFVYDSEQGIWGQYMQKGWLSFEKMN